MRVKYIQCFRPTNERIQTTAQISAPVSADLCFSVFGDGFWRVVPERDGRDARPSVRPIYSVRHRRFRHIIQFAESNSERQLVSEVAGDFRSARFLYGFKGRCRIFFFIFNGEDRASRRFEFAAGTLRASAQSVGEFF